MGLSSRGAPRPRHPPRLALLLLLAVGARSAPLAAPQQPGVFTPLEFGADPSGRADSTAALSRCVAAALNATRALPGHAVDGSDHGGVSIDLQGGLYLLSSTVTIGDGAGRGGNWHLCCGSLLAAANFSGDYLLSVAPGNPKTQANGVQDISIQCARPLASVLSPGGLCSHAADGAVRWQWGGV